EKSGSAVPCPLLPTRGISVSGKTRSPPWESIEATNRPSRSNAIAITLEEWDQANRLLWTDHSITPTSPSSLATATRRPSGFKAVAEGLERRIICPTEVNSAFLL